MEPKNDRSEFTTNLAMCAFHPESAAVGWRDVRNEDGTVATIGVCLECAGTMGAVAETACFVPIFKGKPCRCGPGFCATDRNVGFQGVCRPDNRAPAPDCTRCGATNQSTAGCWACDGLDDKHLYLATAAVFAVKHNVAWLDVFDFQDNNPNLDFEAALAEFVRRRDAS